MEILLLILFFFISLGMCIGIVPFVYKQLKSVLVGLDEKYTTPVFTTSFNVILLILSGSFLFLAYANKKK